jgi:hypothetical protein
MHDPRTPIVPWQIKVLKLCKLGSRNCWPSFVPVSPALAQSNNYPGYQTIDCEGGAMAENLRSLFLLSADDCRVIIGG